MMQFHQFEALYWIARLGSFHAAARHLKTSQPAISGRIRDLEHEFRVSLFDRTQRKVRLTPKGYELLQYATQFMTLADEIKRRLGEPEIVAGLVRLGVTGVGSVTWARELIRRVRISHPEIKIELTVENSELLAEHMEAGRIDIAVMAGPIESSKIICEKIGVVTMDWLASPAMQLPEGIVTASLIAALPIITDRPGSHLHSAAMDWFRQQGCAPQIQHACSSLGGRIQMAAQGIGIALAASAAAEREITRGRLRVAQTDLPMPSIDYVLAQPVFGMAASSFVVAEAAKLLIAGKRDFESYYLEAERTIDLGMVSEDDRLR